jgi:drug/metabolite transporter (DMT)-like permease
VISPRRSRFPGGAFAALLTGATILAFGGWLIRLADVGPVASAFWRVTLAFPFLLLLVRVTDQPVPRDRRLILIALLAGVFFAANLAIWHSGVLLTRIANAMLFGNVASFLFVGYGFLCARRLPGPAQWVALALAVAGVALLLGRSYELSPDHVLGDLLCIIAGVSFTGYLIAMDQARGRLAALPTLAISTAAGIPILFVASLVMGQALMPTNWLPLILLAFGSQLIGQGLMVYAIGHLSPIVVGLTLLVQPAVGAALGWVFYDERLDMPDFIGMVAIAIALVLIRGAPKRGPIEAA